MKKSITFLGIGVAFFMLSFILAPKKKKVIFFGDSITQAATDKGGYIDLMNQLIKEKGKETKFELLGKGISGNKVPDLQSRLAKDVLAHQPDLVFIYIGINDVWHYSHPCCKDKNGGTPKDKFEDGLKDIIAQIQKTGAKVILCTPTVIGEKYDGTNEQDKMLEEYADISRKVAKSTKAKLCDLRNIFITRLKKDNLKNQEKDILTYDGVHLNKEGNTLIANSMIKFLK